MSHTTSDTNNSYSSMSARNRRDALNGVYGDAYYAHRNIGSLSSARVYLGYLFSFFEPESVLDVGCGRGAWLAACLESGIEAAHGLDGAWNSPENMMDELIAFSPADLNAPFETGQKYDLTISLEVAEHLEPGAAEDFVRSITFCSDVVLFSAALPGQGGKNHINEQWPSYWADLFSREDYEIFDLFRSRFWRDDRVEPWYRQNTFLYVKEGHLLSGRLKEAGLAPLADLGFMDCVHPDIFKVVIDAHAGFKYHLSDLAPSLMRAIKRRS